MISLIQLLIVVFALDHVSEATLLGLSGVSYNCSGQLNSDHPCTKAFDNNVTSFWLQSINVTLPQQQYIVFALSEPMIVTSYQVYMLKPNEMLPCELPVPCDYSWQVTSWAFEGSNSGSSYTTLSTVKYYDINNIISPGTKGKFILFNCSSPSRYKYYRFRVIANWFIDNGYGNSDTLMLIELRLNVTSNQPSTQQPQSSTSLSTDVLILVVVLVIGTPLIALFVWYSWPRLWSTSWHQLGPGPGPGPSNVKNNEVLVFQNTRLMNPL